LKKIFVLLRSQTGHDFSEYKPNTIARRIERRMAVQHIEHIDDYVLYLRKHAGEIDALFRDLLIGVTSFFRDPDAFKALQEEAIVRLLSNKPAGASIRVWVPGCSSGEEAYSIAILLQERMEALKTRFKLMVFATDIDSIAIEHARAGVYPASIAADVSPERLARFFTEEPGGGYFRISKVIRDILVFSEQDVIKDPPFSRLDLISCRNLLIYMGPALHRRLIPLFHYALNPGGFLFLGTSESIGEHVELFVTLNRAEKLYQRKDDGTPLRLSLPRFLSAVTASGAAGRATGKTAGDSGTQFRELTERSLLQQYAAVGVLVDDRGDILYLHGRTGEYLEPAPGEAELNILKMARQGLRTALSTALHRSVAKNEPVSYTGLRVKTNGDFSNVDLVIRPVAFAAAEQRLFLVVLAQTPQVSARPEEQADIALAADAEGGRTGRIAEQMVALKNELREKEEYLQSTNEELETSNEELKSANEEMQSINEEMQSTNEELETSKEELQSVNEELETVNAELNSKVESLDRAISDRKNLLESTQIATIFLDNNLRVKSFTPAIAEIFHLIERDLGRPITDIVTRIAYENLPRDVSRVLRTLSRIEQEVTLADGSASYIMRILPYRTIDNVIDGVVMTFIDITERKRNEEAVARLAAIVANSQEAIVGMTPDAVITSWNGGAERIYGYPAAEAIGQPLTLIMDKDRAGEARRSFRQIRRPAAAGAVETERRTKDGRQIFVLSSMSPIRAGNKLIGVAAIERDITDRKLADRQQKVLLSELNHRVKNTLATVLSIFARTRQTVQSLPELGKSFEGRVRALAGAHDLLSRNSWSGVDLRQLLQQELAPYADAGDGAVALAGKPIFLSAQAGVALGMIVHELATNAAKHGALSRPNGRIAVAWKLPARSAPTLTLSWEEHGGPPVARTRSKGFGLSFMQRSLAHDLKGTLDLRFAAKGLRATLRIPLRELQAAPAMRKPRS